MSNRKIRVGELIKREISDILHTQLRGRSTLVTITNVDVSPDNKNARVLYSAIETKDHDRNDAHRLLEQHHAFIKRELAKRIILKYMPVLEFQYDEIHEQAARVNALIDELDNSEPDKEQE